MALEILIQLFISEMKQIMNKIIDLANKIDEPELYEALLMRVLDEIYLMSQE